MIRARVASLNSSTRSLPASFAWYMAASASRSRTSGIGLAGRGDAAADADADVAALAGDVERLRQRAAQPSGGDRGHRRVARAAAQDRELVAAQARDQVALAHGGPEPLRDLDQQAVAGLVPEAVVDDLEVVEVEEQHRDALAGRGGGAQRGRGRRRGPADR